MCTHWLANYTISSILGCHRLNSYSFGLEFLLLGDIVRATIPLLCISYL